MVFNTNAIVAINSLVKDERWEGPLRILRWVAQNLLDVVAECEGKDKSGIRIVRFLVFPDIFVCEADLRGSTVTHPRYPPALEAEAFFMEGRVEDELPIPGPMFP